MATERIRIMISSRCEDKIRTESGDGWIKLTDFRQSLKKEIEATTLFDRSLFECWIHEDEPALAADRGATENCLLEAARCHIMIALYNGNAGYASKNAGIGICHAELMEVLNTAPGKLRLIDIRSGSPPKLSGDRKRNQRFVDYVDSQDPGKRFAAHDGEARSRVLEVISDVVIRLTDRGASALRGGQFSSGAPLDWSRYDFAHRKEVIESTLIDALSNGGTRLREGAVYTIGVTPVYFRCHAIPAATSIAAAREMVGRPFLRDHESLADMKNDIAGPVHVIGCHRTITENQALSLLGFPDATVVKTDFGIYVADDLQKIQLAFLANCRDDTTTRRAVDQLQTWLSSSGEAEFLARRAKGRRAIVTAIAAQAKS